MLNKLLIIIVYVCIWFKLLIKIVTKLNVLFIEVQKTNKNNNVAVYLV